MSQNFGSSPYQPQNQENPYGAAAEPNPYAPQRAVVKKKEKNTLGTIALVCAILGVIFSCVKGALIIGWVLLPISFILGLVAMFGKDKPRGKAIAAIILSIIGTVVAATFFMFVVGEAFDDSFNKETNAVTQDGEQVEDGVGTTRENPLPLGTTVVGDEWSYTVNSVDLNATDAVLAANSFNEPPAEGNTFILVNITATYNGEDPEGQYPAGFVQYVSPAGNSFSAGDPMAVAPDDFDEITTLYQGASTSGNKAIEVPLVDVEKGVIAINPDMLSEKKFIAVQ